MKLSLLEQAIREACTEWTNGVVPHDQLVERHAKKLEAALAQQAQPLSDEDARRAGDAYVASNHRYATRDDFVAGWSAALVAADKDRDFRATPNYEKAIGGSDVCATCETHVVVMIEKEDHLPHKPGECACCDWHR